MHRNMIRHQRLVAMLMSFLVASLLRICLFSLIHPPHFPNPPALSPLIALSLSFYHPSPNPFSFFRSLWMNDVGTEGQTDEIVCSSCFLKSNSCLWSFFFFFANLQGRLSVWWTLFHYLVRMTFFWIAESTPLQCPYKYWWSQMSQWSHVSWWLDTHAL